MFPEDERTIFEVEMPDGTSRHYDPLELQDRMIAESGGKLNRLIRRRWEAHNALTVGLPNPNGDPIPLKDDSVDGAELQYAEAEMALCGVARKAFGFDPINQETGEGIPSSVVLSILDGFLEWRSQKKSSTDA